MKLTVSAVAVIGLCLACAGKSDLSGTNKEKSATKDEASDAKPGEGVKEADDEDLMAIPPESIAGAYLTCDVPAEPRTKDTVVFGCAIFDAKDARLSLAGIDAKWDVVDDAGVTVQKTELADPGEFDKAWTVAQASIAGGLNGQVAVAVVGAADPTIVQPKAFTPAGTSGVDYQ